MSEPKFKQLQIDRFLQASTYIDSDEIIYVGSFSKVNFPFDSKNIFFYLV